MRKAVLFASVMLLSGCAVKYNPVVNRPTLIDTPPVGEIATAQIGDYLLQKGEIVEEDVLVLRVPVDGALYDVLPGSYPQFGFSGEEKFYHPAGIVKSGFADPFMGLSTRPQNPGQLCVVTTFSARVCYDATFEVAKQASARTASFQQTLIYNGRVGNKINVGYREFSNSMARPAFNNNVEYDLSVSSTIGYKGATLEVIKADNSSITYRVVRTFR